MAAHRVPDPADAVAPAVANNAAWCDLVCRTLDLPTRWTADAWTAPRRTPDGYPDAVTLRPQAEAGPLLAAVDRSPGCSVKDSFARLDLAPEGFAVLFEATWLQRPAADPGQRLALDWRAARTAAELASWAEGHDLDVFVPGLLGADGLTFFSAPRTGAGFAAYRTGDVVGVSNAVPGQAAPALVWTDLVTLIARTHPGLPVVGYESGPDLEAARAAGFAGTGGLRVWRRPG